jgi:hypothetical protein
LRSTKRKIKGSTWNLNLLNAIEKKIVIGIIDSLEKLPIEKTNSIKVMEFTRWKI